MYASIQQMIDAYGEAELIQLTDREASGDYDAALITRALTDADELINSYLSQRYTLPLPATPQVIVARVCDIARWRLYKDAPSEEVRKRYEEAVSWLRDVVAGRAGIGYPDASQQPAGGSGARHGQAVSQFDWAGYE